MSGYRITTYHRRKDHLWQCELCGVLVAHVDRHADWHEQQHGIKYGERQERTGTDEIAALRNTVLDYTHWLKDYPLDREGIQRRLEIMHFLASEGTEANAELTCPLCGRPESDNFRSDQIISCSHAFHAPKSDPGTDAASEDTEPGSPTGLWRELEDAKRSWEQMPEWVKRQSQPFFDAHERAVAKHRAAVSDLVAGTAPGLYVYPPTNREPQPSDGPEYHADHAAWEERNAVADPQVCALCGCSCGRCRHRDGGDDHTRECKERFWREQGCLPRP